MRPKEPAYLKNIRWIWMGLGLLTATALLLLAGLWSSSNLSGWVLGSLVFVLAGITEWLSALSLHRYEPTSGQREPDAFRMTPHIFTHFLPSQEYPDITKEGFRITRPPHSAPPWQKAGPTQVQTLYLAGDCTFFEEHLELQETFAHQLENRLLHFKILNAGTDHYTALHSYNRLVVDLVRGNRPEAVLFSSAANDALSFIHHKNKITHPDHTHFCRPWSGTSKIYRRLSKIPSATVRLMLSLLLFEKRKFDWDESAEEITPTFQEPWSVQAAQALFNPSAFVTCLELFHHTCKGIGAQLILATFAYQTRDMTQGARRVYAWGIDRLNEEIRTFAKNYSLPLIDWAAQIAFDPQDIHNKWHYTASGNRRRVELAGPILDQVYSTAEESIHELSRR